MVKHGTLFAQLRINILVKLILTILFISIGHLLVFANDKLDGKWQGVIVRAGHKIENGTLLYLKFSSNDGRIEGTTREEIYDTDKYAVKLTSGKYINETLTIHQKAILKSSKSSKLKWCLLDAELKYNPVTGYLEGTYESSDCKRIIGKIILFRAEFDLAEGNNPGTSHLWFESFKVDYKNGLSAPEVRKRERDNFVFEPVFFDFDKSNIRDEHDPFLDRLIKVVKGHSDLRVKVTGHTDSDGSDGYNDKLSKRRAEAIIKYFVKNGLDEDRLEFDFKGEKSPIDTNGTKEGKQRNRRVDFSFI